MKEKSVHFYLADTVEFSLAVTSIRKVAFNLEKRQENEDNKKQVNHNGI